MSLYDRRGTTASNPELENIRNTVIKECAANNNEWVDEIINKTNRIHAGFLFEDDKTLQEFCLFVGETQNKLSDPGWTALGHHLGLNPCALKVINNNNFNKEDPTYNTLLAYVQHEDATIGKIVQSLKNMGRLDVISRISKSINDLADMVLQYGSSVSFDNSLGDNSDYGSLQLSEGRHSNSSSDFEVTDENSYLLNQNQSQHIFKPNVIPPAPFIFQNIRANPQLTSQRIQQSLNKTGSQKNGFTNSDINLFNIHPSYREILFIDHKTEAIKEYESIKSCAFSTNRKQEVSKITKQKYGKIIMLTFATDGEKYVKEVCQILRKDRGCFPKIGVLVLSEHIDKVMKNPQDFITASFYQVDYICPILTETYFKLVTRQEKPNLSDFQPDARYAQFVYSLMNKYYIANGCINDKIRCVIPDEIISKLSGNLLMSMPVFSSWVKLSEVEELAIRLLKSKR